MWRRELDRTYWSRVPIRPFTGGGNISAVVIILNSVNNLLSVVLLWKDYLRRIY
jgi:hypothetical protein